MEKSEKGKIFVLATDVLLCSENATLRFGSDNTIVIPSSIFSELGYIANSASKSFIERKYAREILETLDSFKYEELLNGIKQENGSILQIAPNKKSASSDIDTSLFNSSELALANTCLRLQNENPKNHIVLISNRPDLRLKFKGFGIDAQIFKDALLPSLKDQYTGRSELIIDDETYSKFMKNFNLALHDLGSDTYLGKNTNNLFVLVKKCSDSSKYLGLVRNNVLTKLRYAYCESPFGYKPKNNGQKCILEMLMTPPEIAPLNIIKGDAGTGKTYAALCAALAGKREGLYKEILFASPVETVGQEEIGFLPGEIDDKLSPHLGGLLDNLDILVQGGYSDETFAKYNISIQSIGYIRGRSITNSFVIIDEAQNIDPIIIKSIVTRAGEGSKFVFLGDPTQIDNPKLSDRYNGLVYLSERMKENPLCWQITLNPEESVRSPLAKIASQLL